MREPIAEFAGVAVFLIIGTGVDCQVVLSTDPAIASSQTLWDQDRGNWRREMYEFENNNL